MANKTRKIVFNLTSLVLGFSAAILLFPASGGLSGVSYSDLKQEFLRVKNYEQELKAYESELKDKATRLSSLIDSLQLPESRQFAKSHSDKDAPLGVGGAEEDLSFDPSVDTEEDGLKKISIRHHSTVDRLANELERLKAIPIGAPVVGQVSSNFGYRISPFTRRPHFHSGLDISVPYGTPVTATADGVVTNSEWDGAYGNMVTIDHGFGLKSSYAHLSSFNVRKGQRIARGQVIGKVGMTGRTTGPHVHYEIRLNSKLIDPGRFVMLARDVKDLDMKI